MSRTSVRSGKSQASQRRSEALPRLAVQWYCGTASCPPVRCEFSLHRCYDRPWHRKLSVFASNPFLRSNLNCRAIYGVNVCSAESDGSRCDVQVHSSAAGCSQ